MFIDPYATELEWETLEAIALTRKIDAWLLFPFAALIRMLPLERDRLQKSCEDRIDRLLGTTDWREVLYRQPEPPTSDTTPPAGTMSVTTHGWAAIPRGSLNRRLRAIGTHPCLGAYLHPIAPYTAFWAVLGLCSGRWLACPALVGVLNARREGSVLRQHLRQGPQQGVKHLWVVLLQKLHVSHPGKPLLCSAVPSPVIALPGLAVGVYQLDPVQPNPYTDLL